MDNITERFLAGLDAEKTPDEFRAPSKVADGLSFPEALALVIKNKSKFCLARIRSKTEGAARKYVIYGKEGFKYFLVSLTKTTISWCPSAEDIEADDWAIFKLPKNR